MVNFYLCASAPDGAFQPVEGDHCPYCGAPIIDHEQSELPLSSKYQGGIVNPKSPPTISGTIISREV